jgi:uncharacterized membrane protein
MGVSSKSVLVRPKPLTARRGIAGRKLFRLSQQTMIATALLRAFQIYAVTAMWAESAQTAPHRKVIRIDSAGQDDPRSTARTKCSRRESCGYGVISQTVPQPSV